jgi:hypothetical protein
LSIVGTACQLQQPTSLEASAVAGLCVPEIDATFVSLASRQFFGSPKACRLVARLREEVRGERQDVERLQGGASNSPTSRVIAACASAFFR